MAASSACLSGKHRTAASPPSAPRATIASQTGAVKHGDWRPRHQGGADLSTGVYGREDDDLVVQTPMPIVLRRTYNSGDQYSRQFGIAWTHPGEWWIRGNSDPRVPWGELILANGFRVRFTRISPGDTRDTAVLRHDGGPSEFDGALITWTGSQWDMRFRDGSAAKFLDCHDKPFPCSLVERRDPDGHRITYVRDASGTLLRMESEGQSIAFEYDEKKRITRAYDSAQHEVRYSYDDRGRLVAASSSDGTSIAYGYDGHDRLVDVREPRRIIHNQFDENGHWVHQVVRLTLSCRGLADRSHGPYRGPLRRMPKAKRSSSPATA